MSAREGICSRARTPLPPAPLTQKKKIVGQLWLFFALALLVRSGVFAATNSSLRSVWRLRKAWSVKRAFRKQLSAAIHHLQSFGVGGSRHDGSDRNHSASSRGSQESWAYSTEADDEERSRATSAATDK
jgi:hypothetical protein